MKEIFGPEKGPIHEERTVYGTDNRRLADYDYDWEKEKEGGPQQYGYVSRS